MGDPGPLRRRLRNAAIFRMLRRCPLRCHYTYAATSLVGDYDFCQLLEAATRWRPVQPFITPARIAWFSPLLSCSFSSPLLSTMGSVYEPPYDTCAKSQVARVEHAKYRTSTGGSIIGNATAKTNRVLDSSPTSQAPPAASAPVLHSATAYRQNYDPILLSHHVDYEPSSTISHDRSSQYHRSHALLGCTPSNLPGAGQRDAVRLALRGAYHGERARCFAEDAAEISVSRTRASAAGVPLRGCGKSKELSSRTKECSIFCYAKGPKRASVVNE
jgi:hypothetical protein